MHVCLVKSVYLCTLLSFPILVILSSETSNVAGCQNNATTSKLIRYALFLNYLKSSFSFYKEKIVVYFVDIHVFYSTSRILNIWIIKLVIFISCDIYSSYIGMTAGTRREIAETDHMSKD